MDKRVERALKWWKQAKIVYANKEGKKLLKDTIKELEKLQKCKNNSA